MYVQNAVMEGLRDTQVRELASNVIVSLQQEQKSRRRLLTLVNSTKEIMPLISPLKQNYMGLTRLWTNLSVYHKYLSLVRCVAICLHRF